MYNRCTTRLRDRIEATRESPRVAECLVWPRGKTRFSGHSQSWPKITRQESTPPNGCLLGFCSLVNLRFYRRTAGILRAKKFSQLFISTSELPHHTPLRFRCPLRFPPPAFWRARCARGASHPRAAATVSPLRRCRWRASSARRMWALRVWQSRVERVHQERRLSRRTARLTNMRVIRTRSTPWQATAGVCSAPLRWRWR